MSGRIILCTHALTPAERQRIASQVQAGVRAWPTALAAEWGIPSTLAADLIRRHGPRSSARSLIKQSTKEGLQQ